MLSLNRKQELEQMVQQAINEGTFPGIEILFAQRNKIIFNEAFGFQTAEKTSPPLEKDSLFDLASLTKPLATAIAILKLVEKNILNLSDSLAKYVPEYTDKRSDDITISMLLTHISGLPAWVPLYEPSFNIEAGWNKLLSTPLENVPGKKMVYSCLGYIFLGEIIRRVTNTSLTDYCNNHIYKPLCLKNLGFNPIISKMNRDIIPTGYCPYRKTNLRGIVHDENSGLFNGEGGNSGLFGTASDIFCLSNALISDFHGEAGKILSQPLIARMFMNQNHSKLEPRTFGWDIKEGDADYWSCSHQMPNGSVGHLGFTGTSLWMDPETGFIIILLSNRVILGRETNIPLIRSLRPRIHALLLQDTSLESNTV